MKKNLQKLFTLLSIATLAPVVVTTVSCGKKEEEKQIRTITWQKDDNATIKVDGYDSLPTELRDGTEITFSVTVASGYKLDRVRVNSKRINSTDGKYKVSIKSDTTIAVSTIEEVESLTIVTQPTKLKYYAGDEIDVTGLKVKAKYKTGREVDLEKGANGYETNVVTFQGGETSYDIIFSGLKQTIQLSEVVRYKVTLDPNGGQISDSYLTKYATHVKSDSNPTGTIYDYNKDDNGIITFAYFTDLATDIQLPTADEITKDGYKFISWKNGEKITKNTNKTLDIKADWQKIIIQVTNMELKIEDDKPMMVMSGIGGVDDKVTLFLYEGNDKVQLVGDSYDVKIGQNFSAKFDLTKLKEARTDDGKTYERKWMDIKFLVGDPTDIEHCEMMEVFKDDLPNLNIDDKIELDKFVYSFAEYNGTLKVFFSKSEYSFSVAFNKNDTTNVESLTLSGIMQQEMYNKVLGVSFYGDTESEVKKTQIGASGEFTLDLPLDMFAKDKNNFAHMHVYEDMNSDTDLLGSGDHNLLITNCTTQFPEIDKGTAGNDISHAISYLASDKYTYYAGYAWDGLMVYSNKVIDAEVESVTLTVDNTNVDESKKGVYYNIKGKYNCDLSDVVLQFDLQNYPTYSDSSSWETTNFADQVATADSDAGKFICSFKVDQMGDKTQNLCYLTHAGINGKSDFKVSNIQTESVVYDGVSYSLRNDLSNDSWANGVVCLLTTPANAQ